MGFCSCFVIFGVVSFFGAGAGVVVVVAAVVTVVVGVVVDAFTAFGSCAALLVQPAAASSRVPSVSSAAAWSFVSVRLANDEM